LPFSSPSELEGSSALTARARCTKKIKVYDFTV